MDVQIYARTIEGKATNQIYTLAKHPAFENSKIRVMPDVHVGKGCTIGFTSTYTDRIIPNVVGVDIGCGMLTCKISNKQVDFQKLDEYIRKEIPHGRNVRSSRIAKYPELQDLFCYRELRDTTYLVRSLGTLGGGNHFIEVDVDDAGDFYIIIHSGSRNLGVQVAQYYQDLAYRILQGYDKFLEAKNRIIEYYKSQGRKKEIQQALKDLKQNFKLSECKWDKDLAYLEGRYTQEYLYDMSICVDFAKFNRQLISDCICKYMGWDVVEEFQTIHNYVDAGSGIIRKGAISANEGQKCLIPINMRDGSLLCIGKGNPEWNYSAPHGAGRILSRSRAKEEISMEEYAKSMEGIYTTSVSEFTLDESPMAYKPIGEIESQITDTVEIVEHLHPLYNFKAG